MTEARNLEREAKLAAGDDFQIPDVSGVGDGLTVTESTTATHTDSYYDTEDLRLIRAGITLRRRDEDSTSTWTVKLPMPDDEIADGLSRLEINTTAKGKQSSVPAEVARLVRARVRTAPLRLVARLRNRRQTTRLGDGGRQVAQIDDDVVTVQSGPQPGERFRELEIELMEQAPSDLLGDLVTAMCEAGAEQGEPAPKLARALGVVAAAPPDLVSTELSDKPSLAEVVRAALTDHVGLLVDHDPVVRLDLDPEGVHQTRVATRRLRADLRTFRPVLDHEWSEPLRDELRWLGRALGTVRDDDVLLDDLRQRIDDELRPADRPGGTALADRLERERTDHLARLQRVLDSPRYRRLLDRLHEAATSPRFADDVDADLPAADVVPELAAKPWKKLRKEIRDLPDEPADAALHEVRIRAKRARYAAEAASPAVGSVATDLADRLADLQGELGDLQDTVVAERWLRGAALAASADEALVAGLLVAREQAEAAEHRANWEAVWDGVGGRKRTRWMS